MDCFGITTTYVFYKGLRSFHTASVQKQIDTRIDINISQYLNSAPQCSIQKGTHTKHLRIHPWCSGQEHSSFSAGLRLGDFVLFSQRKIHRISTQLKPQRCQQNKILYLLTKPKQLKQEFRKASYSTTGAFFPKRIQSEPLQSESQHILACILLCLNEKKAVKCKVKIHHLNTLSNFENELQYIVNALSTGVFSNFSQASAIQVSHSLYCLDNPTDMFNLYYKVIK